MRTIIEIRNSLASYLEQLELKVDCGAIWALIEMTIRVDLVLNCILYTTKLRSTQSYEICRNYLLIQKKLRQLYGPSASRSTFRQHSFDFNVPFIGTRLE